MFKAHRWLYHSTLGSRVIKKKKKTSFKPTNDKGGRRGVLGFWVWGLGLKFQDSGSGVARVVGVLEGWSNLPRA